MPLADLGDSFRSFFDAVDHFFESLAEIQWGSLALALAFFGIYLTIRARASYNVLRAAYPHEPIQFREIWAAYMAGYGFNNVIPARGGDVIRLFLTRSAIPNSSYPAVAAAFVVDLGFDLCAGGLAIVFTATQGVLPKLPDLSKINAFDLSYFIAHPRFGLFVLTFVAIAIIAGTAILSARVRAFWTRVKQGLTVIFDRRRYFRQVWGVQAIAWLFRFTAFWFMLEAFNIGASVRNVLLVLGVNAIASALPFTPGGAGAQQALLVQVFGAAAASATVAAYSVGQQIAIAAFSFGVGFLALFFIFRIRSFKEVIRRGQADRAAADGEPAAAG
ncbi:MAG TPA: lysylphosphatidylglycerol synthase transmembrane domain-containing protein [Thermoleophilaceae bacterium]|nr:lysylphosphatidylglycerol synthase transmembrane domain-containing protein [Thermoleophilaceae bacterium]